MKKLLQDLEYKTSGMFTFFIPISAEGCIAWNEMALHTEGTGKIYSTHLESTLKQLRDAGYIVKECKTVDSKKEIDVIFEDELLNDLKG